MLLAARQGLLNIMGEYQSPPSKFATKVAANTANQLIAEKFMVKSIVAYPLFASVTCRQCCDYSGSPLTESVSYTILLKE
jgi:hypothetical protein